MSTLIFAFFWALTGLAQAAPEAADGERALSRPDVDERRRVALVIGNGAYENTPPLVNPRNDAEDLALLLRGLGFAVVEGVDLGHAAMIRKLREFAVAVRGAEVGLVFYAGHGLQVDGENYMVPIDAQLDSPESLDYEAVPMARVVQELERDPRMSMLILDACRDNPLASTLSRAVGGATRGDGPSDGLAVINAVAPETLVVFSTQPGAVAADGAGRNSPFTEALLTHLDTPGLDVESAIKLVTRDVVAGSGGTQVPFRSSSLTRNYVFRPGIEGAAVAAVEAVEMPSTAPVRADPESLEDELKRLEAEQRTRLEVESQLATERQARIEAASQPLQEEARRLWKQTEKLVKVGGTEAEVAVLKFIDRYQDTTVKVDGEIIDVPIPELDLARMTLAGWTQNRTLALEQQAEVKRKKRVRLAATMTTVATVSWLGAVYTAQLHNNPPSGANRTDTPMLVTNRVLLGTAIGSTLAAGGLYLTVNF